MSKQEQEQEQDPQKTPLLTTAHLRSLTQADSLPAVVSVRNLSAVLLRAARDGWNRPLRPQPVFISAEIAFREPFDSASQTDKLGHDTIHYGNLSKALLDTVEFYFGPGATAAIDHEGKAEEGAGGWDAQLVLNQMWFDLTGTTLDGREEGDKGGRSFLGGSLSRIGLLSVTITLPKASLLGEGVGFTASAGYDEQGRMSARALSMEIKRLRVPTLIGLNPNEREAKQMLIVGVTIEEVNVRGDRYTRVEGTVVKALEESSFETLEALGTHLIDEVEKVFVNARDYTVKVRMEKPIAVPLAECPVVEVRRVVKDYYR
ncbi:hypothetical protein B0T21DRAFT_406716 [Apiosordaria backusii]|uniref:Dihydroneopterin aldolase/epimerase domain-containing protein n=1 Tax=Apiosordaria backusii TaxID=314023 RepID=A0AA40EZ21_9PEZI|nr:hypothetical protein B0T21DRAFT_406716 [Apiosordaria backusii]